MHSLHRSTAAPRCTTAPAALVRGRAAPAPVGCTGGAGTQPGQLHARLTDTACAHAFKCTRSTLGLTLTRTRPYTLTLTLTLTRGKVLSAADTFDDTILDKAPKGGRSKSGTTSTIIDHSRSPHSRTAVLVVVLRPGS